MADLSAIPAKIQALAVAAVTTLNGVQSHADITDPEFAGALFHRGLSVGIVSTDYRTGEAGINRAMSPRYKLIRLAIRVGYLFGRDALSVSATARGSFDGASIDAASDLDTIEAAITQSTAWSGTTPAIVSVRRSGPTTCDRIESVNRALATMFVDVEVSIA